ncbi:MAG TPA: nuclear transport factor 2 family protein [Gammaproteobacteria bacterium]|nr:nuclear transport factor 2 family protein [Gammaproteobacteria bacterium]
MTNNCRSGLLMLAALLSTAGAYAQSPGNGADPAERLAGLEQRVERAEALRAIKRLQYAYGHYVEFGLWHDFADLFADDAVAHYLPGGQDKEEIRELFVEQVGQGQLGLADGRLYPHFVFQPVVTLDPDGATARGRWHLLTLLGGYGGNATWVGNVYENDYVLENGVWKIGELRTYTQFSGSYAGGWTDPPTQAAPAGICQNYLVNDCTIPFHYDAARAGAPLGIEAPAGTSGSSAEAPDLDAALDLDALSARAEEIDRRIARLLDESEVRNLQHAYGYYVDRRLWDDVADLFAADATFELGLRGVYRGRASIRRMLEQFGPQGMGGDELNDHLQLETIVTVAADGATAAARGVDLELWAGGSGDGYRSEWREAVFENTYVKENGVWKIAAVHLYPRFATDYALGWAEDARPAPAASEAFPPDEPPTVVHGVYPEFYIPPFHFANPVTGAPPQYPEGMPFSDESRSRLAVASPTGISTVQPSDASESLTALSTRLDEIERRLAVAVGYDAVENITNAYSFYLDELDRRSAEDLFVADGAIEVSSTEVAGDRDQIRAAMDTVFSGDADGRPQGFFAIHQTLQPVIHVAADGKSARIRSRLFEPTGRIGEEGAWIAGVFENEAVEEAGVWKLSLASIHFTWAGEYSEGWAGAAPFARIADVPFHYDNPVSGRERPSGSRP